MPKFLLREKGMTRREWKQRQRETVKYAMRALEPLANQCGFTPAWEEISQALNLLHQAQGKLSVKNWGY